jgi:ABC-type nitrate/sulfonate/bicarbonate transport system permease component
LIDLLGGEQHTALALLLGAVAVEILSGGQGSGLGRLILHAHTEFHTGKIAMENDG